MTLGIWVKNYLYIPLGGNRHGMIKKLRNLLVSMLIIGLWHGAGWTYIFWGGLHGIYLVINHSWRAFNLSCPKVASWPLTFLAVMVAWVFFRADSMENAFTMLYTMLDVAHLTDGLSMHGSVGVRIRMLMGYMLMLMLCPSTQRLVERYFHPDAKWATICLAAGVVSFYFFSHISDFLYFQF